MTYRLDDEQKDRVAKNIALAHYVKQRFIKKGYAIPIEELESLCTLGLVKAAKGFREDKKTKFATYATRCIENEVNMYFRNNKKHVRSIPMSAITKNEHHNDNMSDLQFEEMNFMKAEDYYGFIDDDFLKKAITLLNDRERLIIYYAFFEELTQAEISKKLEISQSYVSRSVRKALEKMREYNKAPEREHKINQSRRRRSLQKM